MKKSIMLLAAVMLLAGCDKIMKSEDAKKKAAEAVVASEKAQAKLAARLTAKPEKAADTGKAAGALVSLLCSSPKLMEDIESSTVLLEALSGEGGDRNELNQQLQDSRKRYRPVIERNLPARGASFEDFMGLVAVREAPDQQQKLKALAAARCPRGDKDQVEKAAGGLLRCFAPQ